MTAQDAFSSLNYYEIQEMKNRFGISMSQLEELAVEAMYALIWVIRRRTEANLDINTIKNMSFSEVTSYFAEPDDVQAGKDEPSILTG